MKKKSFFIIFKGLSVARNYLRPESVPLTLELASPQNGQTHLNNSLAVADKLSVFDHFVRLALKGLSFIGAYKAVEGLTSKFIKSKSVFRTQSNI